MMFPYNMRGELDGDPKDAWNRKTQKQLLAEVRDLLRIIVEAQERQANPTHRTADDPPPAMKPLDSSCGG